MAPLVPSLLVLGEVLVSRAHGVQQTLLVNERQQRDTLPRHSLTVHIDLERLGVEVNDRGFLVSHQLVERLWDVYPTGEKSC